MKVPKMRFLYAAGLTALLISAFTIPAISKLATKDYFPNFPQDQNWIVTGQPLTRQDVNGKAALIYLWNFTSPYALRDQAVLSVWREKYSVEDAVMLGIHCPTFTSEKELENVRKAVKRLGIKYPIFVDTSLAMWRALGGPSLPAFILVDGEGMIREKIIAENWDYPAIERKFINLIAEKHPDLDLAPEKIKEEMFTVRKPTLFINAGYKKITRFGNTQKIVAGVTRVYTYPENLERGMFYLSGKWKPQEDYLEAGRLPGGFKILFFGSQFYVLGESSRTESTRLEVLLNGKPLSKNEAGSDITIKDGKSLFSLQELRPYQILNQKKEEAGDAVLEFRLEEPGGRIYQFSAG